VTSIVLNPGSIRVRSATMLAPWRGFDLELDPDVLTVPSGKLAST